VEKNTEKPRNEPPQEQLIKPQIVLLGNQSHVTYASSVQ